MNTPNPANVITNPYHKFNVEFMLFILNYYYSVLKYQEYIYVFIFSSNVKNYIFLIICNTILRYFPWGIPYHALCSFTPRKFNRDSFYFLLHYLYLTYEDNDVKNRPTLTSYISKPLTYWHTK